MSKGMRASLSAFSTVNRLASRRDPTLWFSLFALPVLLTALIGLAISGYTEPAFDLGVLDRADSPRSRALVAALGADPLLRVRSYRQDDGEALIRSAVLRGRLIGGLVIPANWDGGTDVELYLTAATYGGSILRALVGAALAERQAPVDTGLQVEIDSQIVGELRKARLPVGFHYTGPANLVLFIMIGGLVGSIRMVNLRVRGISRRLLATPITSLELLAGLAIGPAQLMGAQAVFLIVTTGLAFNVPWGDPLGVVLITVALVSLGVATTLCMGTIFRTPEQALSLSPLIGTVVGMLGGCMWPLFIVPQWMQTLGHVFPSAWGLDAYLLLIFQNGSVSDVLPHVAVLLSMAAAILGLAIFRLRREFTTR